MIRFKNGSVSLRCNSESQMEIRLESWISFNLWGTQISSLLTQPSCFKCFFNACTLCVKLLCDLSCRTTPVIFHHCFYFVVVNFSWASRVWCIFEMKISGTKASKPILALSFCDFSFISYFHVTSRKTQFSTVRNVVIFSGIVWGSPTPIYLVCIFYWLS